MLDRDFCRKVFTLHNKVRMNPKVFIPVLEKAMTRFKGNILYRADQSAGFETKEGQIAYVEAIEFLKS